MCKQSNRTTRRRDAMLESYEGQTLRLAPAGGPHGERARARWRHGFPWWILWLIWPLAGLAKWSVPFYMGALAALRAQLGGLPVPVAAVAAAILIAAGLWLIRRN